MPRLSLDPSLCTGVLNTIRKQKCFICSPFYGRACRWAMLGCIKARGPKEQGQPARFRAFHCNSLNGRRPLQGNLAHKKTSSPRNLQ